jgi:hypothetical protein
MGCALANLHARGLKDCDPAGLIATRPPAGITKAI